MDESEFWTLVETARAATTPTDEALVELLEGRSLEEVVAFRRRFDSVTNRVHRWDVWAAAYLVGGGCSDDSFSDFKAGLVALGSDWFERVAAEPDELASHPLVIEAAQSQDAADLIFDENFGFAAFTAAESGEGGEAFSAALEAVPNDTESAELGDGWDFDNKHEMSARLPRLARLFLTD